MFRVVREPEAIIRRASSNKVVANFITKEISPNFSLSVIRNKGLFGLVTTDSNRIYYVLSGKLVIDIDGERTEIRKGDSCFLSAGSSYSMSGNCQAITVDQPAFGTKL